MGNDGSIFPLGPHQYNKFLTLNECPLIIINDPFHTCQYPLNPYEYTPWEMESQLGSSIPFFLCWSSRHFRRVTLWTGTSKSMCIVLLIRSHLFGGGTHSVCCVVIFVGFLYYYFLITYIHPSFCCCWGNNSIYTLSTCFVVGFF